MIGHCKRSDSKHSGERRSQPIQTGPTPQVLAGLLRQCLAMTALLMLTGCILVNDFTPMWEKGESDSCVSKIAESLYYSEFQRDPDEKNMGDYAHVFTLGDYHFLMLKQNVNDKGGRMYRFGVVHGIFQRYRLVPTMREAFNIAYPNAPVSFRHDTVTLDSLSPEVIKLLEEISSKSEYWEIEDQTLYNTLLNPLCKFDDRNLNALRKEYGMDKSANGNDAKKESKKAKK